MKRIPVSRVKAEESTAARSPVVVVPFRENVDQKRGEQLARFVAYFEKELPWMRVLIVEQSQDGRKFNRGALLNVGAKLALSEAGADSIIFHDVDLLPGEALWPYYRMAPKGAAVHIAKAWTTKWQGPSFLGGVLSLGPSALRKTNGFPNGFWGWGGEDDALRNRLAREGIPVLQPTLRSGFQEMDHVDSRSKPEWKNLRKWEDLESEAATDPRLDGISTLSFKELAQEKLGKKVTKVTVQLG
jgi:hypothetical protein